MNYIQQAYKGHNHFWRYLITTLIVMSPFLLNIAIYFALPELFEASMEEMANYDGNKNFFLLMNLAPFAVLLVFLFLFVKFLHERTIRSLTTSRPKIDWKRVFYAFGLWFCISVAFLAVGFLIAPENMVWNFKPLPFFLLVAISLIFIPLQTSLEEYLFRGYLMQGLGILAKNRWVPLFITSLAFGLLHSFNPEVEKLGWGVMVFYIGTGFFFGVATLMDEGTELALGLHAANNIVAAIFVTTNWTVFQTDALYIDTSEPSLGWETYLPVFIVYPLILFIFSKKYGWSNWQEKLSGKIDKPELIAEN
ncbi:MAG: CPBP family intramembrane metalloprotease [Flavobacteriaceae bacterium]|nr:CPBP family intramembrane metalloprotease [Flavobacteriaceae bacterium]